MRIAFFDTHRFDRAAFERNNAAFGHALEFLEPRLTARTASLAKGCEAACSFVNDEVGADAIAVLAREGVKLLLLRSAGFNHVDLAAAKQVGVRVTRVPEYSPWAVAEHAVALVMALNRKIHRAHARVREWNFSLDGLVGFDMHGKTVGLLGTGRIGAAAARIFLGFGCRVLAWDIRRDESLEKAGVRYVELAEIFRESHVVSLHVPLTPQTRHLIASDALAAMRPGVLLVNTGRGALIDSRALLDALKRGHIGAAALDVYEEEEAVFFRDLSDEVVQDDVLARLLTFPNVIVTSHQAFLTAEALDAIATTTLESARAFERGEPLRNEVVPPG